MAMPLEHWNVCKQEHTRPFHQISNLPDTRTVQSTGDDYGVYDNGLLTRWLVFNVTRLLTTYGHRSLSHRTTTARTPQVLAWQTLQQTRQCDYRFLEILL